MVAMVLSSLLCQYVVLATLLLLLLLGSALASSTISSCDDLKMAIEGGHNKLSSRRDGNDDRHEEDVMLLRLRSDLSYQCKKSIRVAESQSVVITTTTNGGVVHDDDGDSVNVSVSIQKPPQRALPSAATSVKHDALEDIIDDGLLTPSLFVNEGKLRLHNIRFELINNGQEEDGEERVFAGTAVEKGNPSQLEKREDTRDTCGGVRLVQNFGLVAIEDCYIFDSTSGNIVDGSKHRCGEGGPGRVVYSREGNSKASNGGSSTGSAAVTVSRSQVRLRGSTKGVAFFVSGGGLTIDGSRLDTTRSRFNTMDSTKTHPSSLLRGEGMEKAPHHPPGSAPLKTTAVYKKNIDAGASPGAVAVFDGNLVVSDTVFVGRGYGGAGGWAVAFEDSTDSAVEGEHISLVDGCSFLDIGPNAEEEGSPRGEPVTRRAGVVDMVHPRSHPPRNIETRHRQRHLRSTTTVLGLVLDNTLLLYVLSVGFILILVGICLLDRWLLAHPGGLDPFIPRPLRNFMLRRARDDSAADDERIVEGERANSTNTSLRRLARSATKTCSTQFASQHFKIYGGYDEEVQFVVPKNVSSVLEKARARSSSVSSTGRISHRTSATVDTELADSVASEGVLSKRLSRRGFFLPDHDDDVFFAPSVHSPGATAAAIDKGLVDDRERIFHDNRWACISHRKSLEGEAEVGAKGSRRFSRHSSNIYEGFEVRAWRTSFPSVEHASKRQFWSQGTAPLRKSSALSAPHVDRGRPPVARPPVAFVDIQRATLIGRDRRGCRGGGRGFTKECLDGQPTTFPSGGSGASSSSSSVRSEIEDDTSGGDISSTPSSSVRSGSAVESDHSDHDDDSTSSSTVKADDSDGLDSFRNDSRGADSDQHGTGNPAANRPSESDFRSTDSRDLRLSTMSDEDVDLATTTVVPSPSSKGSSPLERRRPRSPLPRRTWCLR